VRQGASWTAAYHLQLTVAAAARPIRGSVRAPGVLAVERSWWLLAQTASARRSVQPVSRGRASSPWSTLPAAKPRASVAGVQQAVPTHPVSASGIRRSGRPVSGHLGSSRASGGRPSAVHPSSVQPSAVRPVRCPAVWCRPRRSGRVGLLHLRRWRWDKVEEAGTRATLPKSRRSVGGRWPVADRAAGLGGGRGGRACPLSDQAGQAGVRSARRRRLRGGHGSGLQREVAALAAWLASSRPRWVVVTEPDARVGGPGGARGVPARGWACGPSAAQASSERAQLGAGSAVTCDDGWWAWLDLNLGPHPYQRWTAERCAIQHFRWSCHSVRPTRMG
jgi:hypothetical protein